MDGGHGWWHGWPGWHGWYGWPGFYHHWGPWFVAGYVPRPYVVRTLSDSPRHFPKYYRRPASCGGQPASTAMTATELQTARQQLGEARAAIETKCGGTVGEQQKLQDIETATFRQRRLFLDTETSPGKG